MKLSEALETKKMRDNDFRTAFDKPDQAEKFRQFLAIAATPNGFLAFEKLAINAVFDKHGIIINDVLVVVTSPKTTVDGDLVRGYEFCGMLASMARMK